MKFKHRICFICFVASLLFQVQVYGAAVPVKIMSIQWEDVTVTDAEKWSVDVAPYIDADSGFDKTPEQYYWDTYNELRKKGYGYDTSERVSLQRAEEYEANYIANSNNKTLQFWIRYTNIKEQEATIMKVSCDIEKNQFRIKESYTLSLKKNTVTSETVPSGWTTIKNGSQIEKAILYLQENKKGAFKNKTMNQIAR